MKSIQETIIKITKAPILCSKCAKKSEIWLGLKDVVSFGDGEFLTDLRIALVDCLKNLSLTLVNSLKTLASEHVNRLS